MEARDLGAYSRNRYAILEVQQIRADLTRNIVKRMVFQAFDVCYYLQSQGLSR